MIAITLWGEPMRLKRLTIGTFNLYNLNEPGLPIYTNADGWSAEQYER
jgi:hypothetical protein